MPKKKDKTEPAAKNTNIRIGDDERDAVMEDVRALAAETGIRITLGLYTKTALMNYARLRKMEKTLRYYQGHGGSLSQAQIAEVLG